MKLKVWNEDSKNDSYDKQLFVKLEMCGHGDIHIVCVDKTGTSIQGGHIANIDQDLKCLILSDGINPDVPLKTDIDNQLMFLTENEYRERRKEQMHQHFMASMFKQSSQQEQPQPSTH